ncbi:antitoxin of toxin-antitoxin stability system [Companilactobacillus suantsaicola]|uniref:Antitoxin of toxin-antitoxin stability system n=1 Tax=Companilactobacillus suantsaicola TaxID=2487723 RepID=A0A4Z0JFS1_9LACO|nr:antitoxin of toxin-antitoxin stability system [Companilactobacillus suantsaicola]TGD21568.1 antitoxin of toxin-antitoxin stability system [Companilactobacillus suantsaicola]
MRKISVPKSIKAEDLEYDVFQGRFGELVYLKKIANPFEDEEFLRTHDLIQEETFSGPLMGKEIFD